MTILVIDVGTSSVRAMALAADGTVFAEQHEATLPRSPSPGLVEFDAAQIATVSTSLAASVTADVVARGAEPPGAIGIANQRASTVVWDADTGAPVGPGLGWQDLRTVGRCLELGAQGRRLAPNMTATKAEWLITHAEEISSGRLRVGTIDAWLAWHFTAGALHITDATNAAITGLANHDVTGWDTELLAFLGIPASAMPTIVDTVGPYGPATTLEGAPPLAALVGDQQASMVGQGCIDPGTAKITFGTGAMLDLCLGTDPPTEVGNATFPIIARRNGGQDTYGIEAVMLSAGAAVEWLRDGLGLIDDVAESATLAASVPDAGGVTFVPSLSGTGTPDWDHGARGLLGGLSRGTTKAHVVRAVLEGVAHRGADLVDAVDEATSHIQGALNAIKVDGGMTDNTVFVQALADACNRPIEVSGHREATAVGAGLLAGVAVGQWADLPAAIKVLPTPRTVAPSGHLDRDAFRSARARAGQWIPALSALDL